MRPNFALIIALIVSVARPAHADCELLYAPPAVRARLLAFHYANEMRRERELRPRDQQRGAVKPRPVRARPLPTATKAQRATAGAD